MSNVGEHYVGRGFPVREVQEVQEVQGSKFKVGEVCKVGRRFPVQEVQEVQEVQKGIH